MPCVWLELSSFCIGAQHFFFIQKWFCRNAGYVDSVVAFSLKEIFSLNAPYNDRVRVCHKRKMINFYKTKTTTTKNRFQLCGSAVWFDCRWHRHRSVHHPGNDIKIINNFSIWNREKNMGENSIFCYKMILLSVFVWKKMPISVNRTHSLGLIEQKSA